MSLAGSARQRRTAWSFVGAQFALLGLVIFLPGGDAWPVSSLLLRVCDVASWIGIAVMVVAALGLGRGLTAAPLPNAKAQLRTGGMYGVVRHPIYFGLLLFTVAHVMASGSALVALFGVMLVVLMNFKARWEERRLVERFADYSDYARRTPRFVPGLRVRTRA